MKKMKWALGVVSLLAITGCYDDDYYDPYYYDAAYYDPYYGSYDAAWSYSYVDPVYSYWYYSIGGVLPQSTGSGLPQAPVDVNAAAAQLAANASSTFTPAGCATATASGATVNYTFNNCEAQIALQQISGDVQAVLADNAGQLTINATSSNLTINGAPYNLSLQIATSPPDGDQRKVTITSNSYSPERFDTRSSESTVTWVSGSGCFTMDSQSQSTRGDRNSTTTVSGYQRCANQCPSAGTVTSETSEGTFNTTFTGSNVIEVTSPGDETQTYTLDC
ncbi:hypothetical protein [Corallococcus aberystwythensis]|uniref:Lipoprotein n=1 Tax=Corallococcus aberystwythensis TaxID=2316722 RepID=A0A3A8QX68_9BACT|nr:hypothetical protein [Corallococcus aberystwythensis]RKH73167.1 hypothetical protein D7W81_04610 [Corallococcus aberystwythensis]